MTTTDTEPDEANPFVKPVDEDDEDLAEDIDAAYDEDGAPEEEPIAEWEQNLLDEQEAAANRDKPGRGPGLHAV